MRDRRRWLAVSLLGCLLSCSAGITSLQAGPLLDWLFHRNRSPDLSATAPATNATVAGYPPAGSCGAGWCQQTVVRYLPQVAYRTVYQPVPVTTYKTSTTINPANGLPLTCTRPCTSYRYQMRRVPYTTYRPVYTTVPVSDPLNGAASAATSTAAPPYDYQSSYQPNAISGCNPATGVPAVSAPGYARGIPSYGNGSAWSSAPVPNGYSAPSGSSSSTDPSGATEWQPLGAQGAAADPPWQTGNGAAAPSGGQTPADRAPSLRPNYGDALVPVPMPDALRERLREQGTEAPDEGSAADDDVTDFNRIDRGSDRRGSARGYADARQRQNSLFETPSDNARRSAPHDPEPSLEPPSNQEATDPRQGAVTPYHRAIRDIERSRPRSLASEGDKTAQRSSRLPIRGEKPQLQEDSRAPRQKSYRQTRYAAVPIAWPESTRRVSLQSPPKARPSSPSSSRAGGWIPR